MEKFRRLPGVEGSAEILLGTKDAELLQLMVGMVQDHLVAEIFLQLAKQACCEVWCLFEVRDVEFPLVMKKGFGVLGKGWWKSLSAEPFSKGCLKS